MDKPNVTHNNLEAARRGGLLHVGSSSVEKHLSLSRTYAASPRPLARTTKPNRIFRMLEASMPSHSLNPPIISEIISLQSCRLLRWQSHSMTAMLESLALHLAREGDLKRAALSISQMIPLIMKPVDHSHAKTLFSRLSVRGRADGRPRAQKHFESLKPNASESYNKLPFLFLKLWERFQNLTR